jgi:hypothetical protein
LDSCIDSTRFDWDDCHPCCFFDWTVVLQWCCCCCCCCCCRRRRFEVFWPEPILGFPNNCETDENDHGRLWVPHDRRRTHTNCTHHCRRRRRRRRHCCHCFLLRLNVDLKWTTRRWGHLPPKLIFSDATIPTHSIHCGTPPNHRRN